MWARIILATLLILQLSIIYTPLSDTSATFPDAAQAAPPPPVEPPGKPPKPEFKRITPSERKAAAKRFQATREKADTTQAPAPPTMDPGGVPHYFGPYPNYANSPLPSGPIASITLTNPGTGYTNPTVTIEDVYANGTGAAATASVDPTTGAITAITLTDQGSNYIAPVVKITDSTGTGATATATIGTPLQGGIRKFVDPLPTLPIAVPDTISYPAGGKGYTSAPTITIVGGNGTGATATATVADGKITAITVTNGGSGYTSPPNVLITGGGGYGAFALARVENGKVVAIDLVGSDYYEIELREFWQQMHSDLPPTKLRGYVQTNYGTDANGNNTIAPPPIRYLGPVIIAQRDRPVRIKFTNKLPTGDGGDLFIPVDTTVTGAGTGPLGGTETYTENRATVHLHGGFVPWISDGTPHQWITPAGENTSYPKGVSVYNVPDMPDPGDGSMTFYYNNQQSARMMFYHDHSYGITRLNVYAGEAAGYLITDQVEQDLINGTNQSGVNPEHKKLLPDLGIPLIIQDKTFVDAKTIATQDPTWKWGTTPPTPRTGDLWYPHVYMPNQNPWDPSGINAFGRWHYGPWFWPPTNNITYGPIPNPYYDCYPGGPCTAPWEPPQIPATPNPSTPGEAFMDTPVVNGTAYPYLEVDPKAYRFRILNAADDRFFNLQLYLADPDITTPDGRTDTEVKMVPAAPGLPDGWPTDGREGGVPDPNTAGPPFIQIGTEGGFLPEPVVLYNKPITWNWDQTNFDFGNVNGGTLILGPAERADVIVDFSQFAGKTLILYNDAPAPFPATDPRYDYYTNNPDQTDVGGTPPTLPGYGPNTRTIMQIRVRDTSPASAYDLAGLKAAFAKANGKRGVFEVSQDPIIVPNSSYNSAYAANFPADSYVRIMDTTISFFNGPLSGLTLLNGGSGYTSPPTVTISGGGGTGATAVANLGPRPVGSITVTNGGSGYTSPPTVTISGGGGTGATAVATVRGGRVRSITVTNGGSGYTSPPTVTISGGGGTGATAVANLAPTSVASITVTNGGSGYTSPPTVTISGGGGTGATAVATLGPGSVASLTLTNPGSGYTSAPTVTIFGGGGTGATAIANGIKIQLQPKAIQDEMGEAFDMMYGRMSAMLGLELPGTAAGAQNFILYPFASPPVELIKDSVYGTPIGSTDDGTQIWKITHNGVDTHTIHFHLFNVQLINRVAWDNAIRPPDPNELGWKETIRVNPLQDTIVALRPYLPLQSFQVPNSIRPIDPTKPLGAPLDAPSGGFKDPNGQPVNIVNHLVNYSWEYVYHCHLLAHEEMDMMHGVSLAVAPIAPTNLVATRAGAGNNQQAVLTWTDNSLNETNWIVQRASASTGPWTTIATLPSTTGPKAGTSVTYTDTAIPRDAPAYYRIIANNTAGDTTDYNGGPRFPTMSLDSPPSNIAEATTGAPKPPSAPQNLQGVAVRISGNPLQDRVTLTWTDTADNETGFQIQRSLNANFAASDTYTVGPNTTTFSQNVSRVFDYYYRVRAFNQAGYSAWSNTVFVNTP